MTRVVDLLLALLVVALGVPTVALFGYVLRALKRTFELDGFEVVTATQPAEAVQMLERGEQFVVIGSDYRMPGMDGAEFLQKARWLTPEDLFYAGFHFAEQNGPLRSFGGKLLKIVAKKGGKNKLAKDARTKLQSHGLEK